MGMYDTVYAELTCPFCGKEYRHSPLTMEQAKKEIAEHKEDQIKNRQDFLAGNTKFYFQDIWARQAGFDNVDAWIEQLDSPEKIEACRTERTLGLAEIQTKEFESSMDSFFVGDEVPKYGGHYFIPEDFKCEGCSSKSESVYVKVWLEIEDRKLKAVYTRNPETNEPEREVFTHTERVEEEPDPNPPIHFNYRGIQGLATYNTETNKYDFRINHNPEQFKFSHKNKDTIQKVFETFADNYLYLLGKESDEKSDSLHEKLHSICRQLPSDFEPYGERERDGGDCSSGCKHFLKLPGKLGADWGICANPVSPRVGLLTFEHQGCEKFEG
jgi:hypothetical protein